MRRSLPPALRFVILTGPPPAERQQQWRHETATWQGSEAGTCAGWRRTECVWMRVLLLLPGISAFQTRSPGSALAQPCIGVMMSSKRCSSTIKQKHRQAGLAYSKHMHCNSTSCAVHSGSMTMLCLLRLWLTVRLGCIVRSIPPTAYA